MLRQMGQVSKPARPAHPGVRHHEEVQGLGDPQVGFPPPNIRTLPFVLLQDQVWRSRCLSHYNVLSSMSLR